MMILLSLDIGFEPMGAPSKHIKIYTLNLLNLYQIYASVMPENT
jgi:hypothetical protein